jgi:hypothetical protein
VLAVLDAWHQLPPGRPITRELIGDHDPRRPALPLEQLAEQALRCPPIPPALHQYVEHHPGLIDGTLEPVLYPSDLDDDLIEMPLVTNSRQPPPDLIGELLTKLECPLPYGFMANHDASAASISSTMRRLSGKRKYSQTAWLITSAGKRWPA